MEAESGRLCYSSFCPKELREELEDLYRIPKVNGGRIEEALSCRIKSAMRNGSLLIRQVGDIAFDIFEEPIEISPGIRKKWMISMGRYGRIMRDIQREDGTTIVRVYPHWLRRTHSYARLEMPEEIHVPEKPLPVRAEGEQLGLFD